MRQALEKTKGKPKRNRTPVINTPYNEDEKSSLVAYYQNVRGLKTKLLTFRTNLITVIGVQIVAITETNLDSSVCDAEVIDGDWSVIRRDRGRPGRGVMILSKAPPI
ncbi:unnamed protein product [Pieris brassicae]|uniref:Uncharacterized protein n=1 Tax=Pieris brassicae TaxID=7116 RepID=A0A9P0TQ30_PIEBR|nr:unnamed protein product [Pieris brassicae]